jgi:hypothetical protein
VARWRLYKAHVPFPAAATDEFRWPAQSDEYSKTPEA